VKHLHARLTSSMDPVLHGCRLFSGLMLLLLLSACATVTGKQAVMTDNSRGIAVVPLVDGATRIDISTDVAFDYGSAELRPAFVAQLATVVKQYQQQTVKVSGYTDNVGAPAFNLDLSQRRAQAVADVLREQGFRTTQLAVSGFGEDNPVASNATETGRRLNRRIELLISAKVP
jgi:outer membrane protein OmpA-like peptidoglycan-associated protein